MIKERSLVVALSIQRPDYRASSSNLCDARSFRQLTTNISISSIFNNHFAPVTYSMVQKGNLIKWLLEKKISVLKEDRRYAFAFGFHLDAV